MVRPCLAFVLVLSSCGDDRGGPVAVDASTAVTDVAGTTTRAFTVGGTVTGLAGAGLVLRDNGGDDLAIDADGGFTFATPISYGQTFAVTIATQPATQTCAVSGDTGTVVGDVSSVVVDCTTHTYSIGGAVTGLVGAGLVLRDNGGDDLVIDATGGFTFATPVADGTTYAVTVAAQPAKQVCVVAHGRGTVAGAAVGSVAVTCAAAIRAIAAGNDETCAILNDGSVKCWGFDNFGQLGLGDTTLRGDAPGEMGDALLAVDLGTGRSATAITAGEYHVCAILDDASVKCWGIGGRLGLGDDDSRGDDPGEMGDALPAVNLGTGRTAIAISAGEFHTCAILDDHRVKCWGDNGGGRLGLGDITSRGDAPNEMGDALPAVDLGSGRTATAIAAGGNTTCAILDDASLKCWGADESGELGQGDTAYRGWGPGQMGDALPAIDLGAGRSAVAIDVGAVHACALLDNGEVKCWGGNESGELGLGDTTNRGDAPSEMGDALLPVDLGSGRTATAIIAAHSFTCARLDDAGLKCWGSNVFGQLGLGDTANRGDDPGELGDALPDVSLGTGRIASLVDGGELHACAVLDDASVKCWGDNGVGELGLGDTMDRGDAPNEMGDQLPPADIY